MHGNCVKKGALETKVRWKAEACGVCGLHQHANTEANFYLKG